jgi:uncharacterized membrane protein YedE/YeeE
MDATQLAQLQLIVLGAAGLISFLFGWVLHRTHFCTMGAVSDAVIMGSFDRLRQWALAIAVAVLGFGLMSYAGLISPLNTIYPAKSAPWLAVMLGGLMFIVKSFMKILLLYMMIGVDMVLGTGIV